MPSRRDFGSVRRLPSKRWQAAYFHEGKRHPAPDTFPTKADAAAWLATVQADILKGNWLNPGAGRVTFGAFARQWLDRRTDLRPTTRSKYESLLRLHIEPAFGATEIVKVSPSAVRSWYHELAGRFPTVADDSYRLLRAICNTAVADGALGRSPCQVKGAGQVRSVERPVSSVAELAAAVEAVPEQYRLAILLAAWCQLRRGEVLALQRRDVDLVHGTIRVERAWGQPFASAPVLGLPKTAAGVRTLTLPPNVIPALENHLSRFVKSPEPEAWLFGTRNGTALSPRNLTRVWTEARASAGRPDLHLHDLRHSGLTWAAASGASVAELMRRGGHANPRAALRYQHATEDRDRAIAAALGALAAAPVVPLSGATRTRRARRASDKKVAPSEKGA